MKILVINPGSTSTKFAVYEDLKQVWKINIHHETEELKPYKRVCDQFQFRKDTIIDILKKEGQFCNFDAVIGRGGLLRPLEGGVYRINKKMKDDIAQAQRQHASNLGALIASSIAESIEGCQAFIADPVVVDELQDVARISGLPELPRVSIFHALNQKAIARRYADEVGKRYEDLQLVVAHLGGGISVGAHSHGRVIDVNNALDGEGPLSPERSGTLPAGQLAELCFSGKYTHDEVKKLISGKGGMVAHLNSNDALAVENAALAGDKKAELINYAMVYGVAKEIGAMHAVLCGETDAILVTGGMARSKYCMKILEKHVGKLAPMKVYPGEDELGALAENAYKVLTEEFTAKEY